MPHKIFNLPETRIYRLKLRKEFTPQEIILWSRIRNGQLGEKFRRQHGIGNYIADFYCPKKQLIIEIDGSQHFDDKAIKYDSERTTFLESKGCKVLRFSNSDINANLDSVLMMINSKLSNL